MPETTTTRLSLDEFLVWDDGTDGRYELIDGNAVPVAMPSEAHSTIVATLCRVIGGALKPPCRVEVEAGVCLPDRPHSYYRADIAVSCMPPQPGRLAVANPVLIAEVLSPETAVHDRGIKLPDYIRLPTVHDILLIDSQRCHAQVWTRRDDVWIVRDLDGEAVIRPQILDADIWLPTLYENVAFG